ncbi:MAG: hypothetical protein H0W90_08545 [Actinobacteria bacterium]|nr:hypothetical protein [Actinomycetota bacterium]
MVTVTTTAWWVIGTVLGIVVVAVVAALLLAIILLARRVVGQAGAIVEALDGAQINTAPLYDVAATNHALVRIVRDLRSVREELSA